MAASKSAEKLVSQTQRVHQKRPRPGRADRNLFREEPLRNQENRNAGERRKNAVDRQQHKRRRSRVNAEHSKHASNEVGIKRRLPSRRPGGRAKGMAEALTGGDRRANASHLPAKAKIPVRALELVGVANDDPSNPQQQGKRDNPKQRRANARPSLLRSSRVHEVLFVTEGIVVGNFV